MRAIKLTFMFLLAIGVAGAATAQTGVLYEEEIHVIDKTLSSLRADLTELEAALADPNRVTWSTGGDAMSSWQSAPAEDLVRKAHFLQLAEARAERKQQAGRLAGLGLPPGLAEMVYEMPNRPAKRIVSMWAEKEGAVHQKALAAYRGELGRSIKLTERWLADHRAEQAAAAPAPATAPATPIDSAFATGACFIPPGKWQVGTSREVLDVEELAGRLRATKTKGSPNIPAGEIHFWIDARTCDGALQWADEGYVNPRWIRGKIEVRWITRGSQFSIEWPEREPVVYTKVG